MYVVETVFDETPSPLQFALTRQKDVSSFDFFRELLAVHNRREWWGSVDCVILSLGFI
jgi:hypothetical protein